MSSIFKSFFILSLFSLLAACGSNLPAPNESNSETGILVIPKSLIADNKAPLLGGIDTELKLLNPQGKAKAIRLTRTHGIQYKILTKMEPGEYTIVGFKSVKSNQHGVRVTLPSSEYTPVDNTSFNIESGKVTVLPYIFTVTIESAAGGGFLSWLDAIYFTQSREEDQFSDLLMKLNEGKDWDIIWPKGSRS